MKKTFKRALIIMAVVMAAVVMMAFAASAATCADGAHITGTTVVEPTCEEAGYTQTYCTVCGKIFGNGDYKEPLGHDRENAVWGYKASGNHYVYEAVCARENCGVVLNDGITYYCVELKNPWVAKTYCADVPYTKLAESFVGEADAAYIKDNKGSNGKDCVWYIRSGDTVEEYIVANYENIEAYNDNNNTTGSWLWNMLNRHLINRIADKQFGLYNFTGWTTDAENLTAEFDIENTEITQNTTLYAKWQKVSIPSITLDIKENENGNPNNSSPIQKTDCIGISVAPDSDSESVWTYFGTVSPSSSTQGYTFQKGDNKVSIQMKASEKTNGTFSLKNAIMQLWLIILKTQNKQKSQRMTLFTFTYTLIILF